MNKKLNVILTCIGGYGALTLLEDLKKILIQNGSIFIEIKIRLEFVDDLIRLIKTPIENKKALIQFIDKI